MTKFEELSSEYKKAFDEIHAYKVKCTQFGAKFTNGLHGFLECPKEKIVPLAKDNSGKYCASAPGYGEFNEDGFFVNYVRIDIPIDTADLSKKPSLPTVCQLHLKEAADGKMEILLASLGGSVHKKLDEASIPSLYPELVQIIKKSLSGQKALLLKGEHEQYFL